MATTGPVEVIEVYDPSTNPANQNKGFKDGYDNTVKVADDGRHVVEFLRLQLANKKQIACVHGLTNSSYTTQRGSKKKRIRKPLTLFRILSSSE